MAEFKAGDVVQVVSGGPRITVIDVGKTKLGVLSAWCVWFEGTKQIEGRFPVVALKHAPVPNLSRSTQS